VQKALQALGQTQGIQNQPGTERQFSGNRAIDNPIRDFSYPRWGLGKKETSALLVF
jgi:hypothetical protein